MLKKKPSSEAPKLSRQDRRELEKFFQKSVLLDHDRCLSALLETTRRAAQDQKRNDDYIKFVEQTHSDSVVAATLREKELSSKVKDLDDKNVQLKSKVGDLEARLKYEVNRAAQALDVASGISTASSSLGRLVHSLVDLEVLDTLRQEQERRRRENERDERTKRTGRL